MLRLVPIQCITFTKKTNLYYLAIVFVVRLTYIHLFLAIHFVFAQTLLLLVLKIQCYHYMLRLVHIQCITFTKKANLYYLAIVFVVCLTYIHLFLAIHFVCLTYIHLFLAIHFVFAQLLLLLVLKIWCYHS